ncbi:MAG: hemerythrin domain-containing protein [Flavobacteriales bacterium]
MPPLERHPLLQPLSREHHEGLLLCWRIRRDLERRIEEVVFPVLGHAHPLVHRAITEHRRLSRLFMHVDDAQHTLSLIEDELEAHIRFEERVLFPLVQEQATAEELERIDRVHGLLMAPITP